MKTFRSWLWLSLWFASLTLARATTVIYPVEAIDDLWQLQADDFKTKYAGINITGLGPSDEGWYVRYRHENLTYMFGPLADNDAALKKKWELETVRDAAIRNRPTLSSSKVDYVKFSYSGVYGKGGGNTPYTGKKGDGKEGAGSGSGDDANGNGSGGDGKDGSGSGGKDGKDGNGAGNGDGTGAGGGGDKLAGGDGTGDQTGGAGGAAGKDGKGGKGGKGGKSGSGDGSGDGTGDDPNGIVGAPKGGLQKVASAKGGGSSGGGGQGGQGGQQGQSGQSGGQGGQGGGQGGQQGQSGQSGGGGGAGGQPGGGGSPGGGSSGGGGNPLQLIGALLRMILGI